MDDDKRAELLMDHYNDTSEHILGHWKTRNRLFGLISGLCARGLWPPPIAANPRLCLGCHDGCYGTDVPL